MTATAFALRALSDPWLVLAASILLALIALAGFAFWQGNNQAPDNGE